MTPRYPATPKPSLCAKPATRTSTELTACGQLHSTVHDLAKWISFQFREDGGARSGSQVLPGSTRAEMHHLQYIEKHIQPDWFSGQCLGWMVSRVGDHVYHYHGGGIQGFASQISFNIPARTGVIFLANAWPLTNTLPLDLIQLALGLEPTPPRPLRVGPAAEPTQLPEDPPADLQPYTGRYFGESGTPIIIDLRGGTLHISLPSPDAYAVHAPETLATTADPHEFLVGSGRGAGERARFHSANDGNVSRFTLGGWWYEKEVAG